MIIESKNLLQKKINKVFTEAFGRTPLTQRLNDIQGECSELCRYTDLTNLKEELGDLLSSAIQLANECDWDSETLISNTLNKIKKRQQQYKSLGRKVKVAILGGAFDPITKGHIQVAQFVLDASKTFDEVWLMPCYKHMYGKSTEAAKHRLSMCELAAQVDGRIRIFDYEIDKQFSGETYHLAKKLLEEDFAKDNFDFSLIIGQDNADTFDKWVNYEELERMMRFVVVPRKGYEPKKAGELWYLKSPHVYLYKDDTPIMEISSTIVRKALTLLDRNKPDSILDYVDKNVLEYISTNKLYLGEE